MKTIISKEKKFLVKDTSKDFHTKDGTIKSKDFNKSKVKTNKKVEFSIFDPQFIDFYEKIKRGAQIISLKDIKKKMNFGKKRIVKQSSLCKQQAL